MRIITIILFSFVIAAQLAINPANAVEAQAADVFDIDGNGKKEALSDGLLALRYLFGFRDNALINQAIGGGATRTSASQVEAYLAAHLSELDIDGNGKTEALSDGLLLLRYLFGFSGESLVNGAIGDGAARSTASAIEAYIGSGSGLGSESKLQVVLSCRKGTVPNSNSATVPLNAMYVRLDYLQDYQVSGLIEEGSIEKFGVDGAANFIFPANVQKVKVAVLPYDTDGAFPIGEANIANSGDTSVFVEKGKTVIKNFILEQAYCDKDRDIRGIGVTNTTSATTFFAVLSGLPDSYDPDDGIRRVSLGVDKLFYTRRKASGDITTAFKLKAPRRFMRIRNIQSIRRIKRICGDQKYNMDITIKSDMELGIKTFVGEGPTGIVNCKKSYTTHMPVSRINDYGDDDFYQTTKGIGLFPENDSTRSNSEYRSSCESEAKMLEAPFDWSSSCFEADQTSSKIFEYIPGDPIGRIHDFTVRFDLGGPELIEGHVNPGVEFD